MDSQELIDAIHIAELTSTDRSSAIRELVDAVDWAKDSVSLDDVVNAIEEREATAQTIGDVGLAFPHAMIEWSGDFRLVLGRSRVGVEYVAAGNKIHLIALLVVGNVGSPRHLEVLAGVADLLNNHEFRQQLINASHVRIIRQLIVERAGKQPKRKSLATAIPYQSVAIADHAVGLARSNFELPAGQHVAAVPPVAGDGGDAVLLEGEVIEWLEHDISILWTLPLIAAETTGS